MLGIIKRLFSKPTPVGSKDIAKERLRLVLLHDRTSVSPQYMGLLRDDMIKAVSNYMDINEQEMEVNLNRDEQTVTLVANIPVSSVKRSPLSRATVAEEGAAVSPQLDCVVDDLADLPADPAPIDGVEGDSSSKSV